MGVVESSSDGEFSRTLLSYRTSYRFNDEEVSEVHAIEALGRPGLLVQLYLEPSKIEHNQQHLTAKTFENKNILHIPVINCDLALGISTPDNLYLSDILKSGELDISTTESKTRLLNCVDDKLGNYEIEFAHHADQGWLPKSISITKQSHHQFENKTVSDFLSSPRGECLKSVRRCTEIKWTELSDGVFVPVALIAIEEMTDEISHRVLTESPVELEWSEVEIPPDKASAFSIADVENGHQVRVEGQENIRFEYHDGEIYKTYDK